MTTTTDRLTTEFVNTPLLDFSNPDIARRQREAIESVRARLGRTYPLINKTMPCAEAILAAGMRRVVVATTDPNPEIAGRGVEVLRNAGVSVDIGLLGEEARWREVIKNADIKIE